MISVIMPVHNEAHILEANVARLMEGLDALGLECEIIISEDGSSDGSGAVARQLASERVLVLNSLQRLGRGLSLSNAIRAAHGDTVLYMDTDLATDLRHIRELADEIERGANIATGSRLLPGSKVHGRGALREFFSRGYNLLLRLLFKTSVHDHQCGFKAFNRQSVLPLLAQVKDRHWFWDSELLIRAQANGMTVTEIPVEWTDRKSSSVRLQSDIPQMGLAAILLRLRMWAAKDA